MRKNNILNKILSVGSSISVMCFLTITVNLFIPDYSYKNELYAVLFGILFFCCFVGLILIRKEEVNRSENKFLNFWIYYIYPVFITFSVLSFLYLSIINHKIFAYDRLAFFALSILIFVMDSYSAKNIKDM